jgi:hypothetical protein
MKQLLSEEDIDVIKFPNEEAKMKFCIKVIVDELNELTQRVADLEDRER